MNGLLLGIEGNWAHFKKPETNNNPLTHDFITKTALLGMIGAVLGLERSQMREVFPQLSDDLSYGVRIHGPVKKESWSFKLRYAASMFEKRPVQMEFLKNPRYTIAIRLENARSAGFFNDFATAVEAGQARYTPVLGLHNCPANLGSISSGDFEPLTGDFVTNGFITEKHRLTNISDGTTFRLGVERIPTYQNDDFWNLPDRYVRVFYPSEDREVSASGAYHVFSDGSQWTLI